MTEQDLGISNVRQERRFGGPKMLVVFAGLGLGTALAAMGLGAGSAEADQPTDPGNSTPGIDRYLNNPGREQAGDVGAQCDSGAGSGAFGYFGKDFNLAGGANGTQTGLNNSAVCGNRQGNLP